jgi:cation:H+ antiporter
VDLIIALLIFVISLIVLVKAAEYFIKASVRIGFFFGIPDFIIGITLVSIGTSLPELAASISAMLKGSSEVVSATIYGSNISNILLIFGLMATLYGGLKVRKDFLNGDLKYLLLSTFFLLFASLDGKIILWEGVLFVIFYGIYCAYALTTTREVSGLPNHESSLFNHVFTFFGAIIMIYFSSDYLVKSLLSISGTLGLGNEIIAATALALGTSLPEVTVALQAMRRGSAALVIGDVVGSNIFNTWFVIGVSSFMGNITVPLNFFIIGAPFLLGATFLYWMFAKDGKINKFEGMFFLLLYVVFIVKTLNLI